MILFTAHLCKILFLLAAMTFTVYLLRKRMPIKRATALACLLVPLAATANYVSGLVPSLTDEVILRALNEKNAASLGYEIVIDGFSVDGENCPVNEIADGKWFWRGRQYMWRPENDSRQPEGITRQVTLKVPVGWERQIQFSANEYRGAVEVVSAKGIERIDTSETAAVTIGRSSTKLLIADQTLHLFVYVMAFSLLLVICVYVLQNDRLSRFHMACLGICVISFIFMRIFGARESFAQDELALINYVTYTDSVFTAMKTDIAWPPLWKGFFFCWYRIAPYGENWLLLPGELLALGGVYLTGMCGKKLANERVGILAAVLTAFNPSFFEYIALECTCYSLLFFCSVTIWYLYITRTGSKENFSWKQIITLIAVMTTAVYTHYFGFFLSGTFFIYDIYLWIKKTIWGKYLIPYPIVGVLFSPWIIYVLKTKDIIHSNYWQPKPTLTGVVDFMKYLAGRHTLVFYIFLSGIMALILIQTKNGLAPDSPMRCNALITIPLILVACVFIYGKFIAIGNTFWVDRYFFVILPAVMLICALFIELCFLCLKEIPEVHSSVIACSVLATIMIFITSDNIAKADTVSKESRQPFRAAAEWLYSSNDIFDPENLVISLSYRGDTNGWIEYYITKQEKRDNLNLRFYADVSKDELLSYNRIIVVNATSINPKYITTSIEKWLEEFYTLTETVDEVRTYVYEKT